MKKEVISGKPDKLLCWKPLHKLCCSMMSCWLRRLCRNGPIFFRKSGWGTIYSSRFVMKMFAPNRTRYLLSGDEAFVKRPLFANLGVRLKFQSSKYSLYSCGLNFRLSWSWPKLNIFQRSRVGSIWGVAPWGTSVRGVQSSGFRGCELWWLVTIQVVRFTS